MTRGQVSDTYQGMLDGAVSLKAVQKRRAGWYSAARLTAFVASAGFAVAAFAGSPLLWWVSGVLFVLFLMLMVMHERLNNRIRFNKAIIEALQQETEAVNENYSAFDGAPEFLSKAAFAADLDLFGEHSVFQALNRTASPGGSNELARWLLEGLTDAEAIRQRQEAVKELSGMYEWRIHFRAHGLLADEKEKASESLLSWLAMPPLFNGYLFSILLYLIPVISVASIVMVAAGAITGGVFLFFFLLPVAITGMYTAKINRRHTLLSRKVDLFGKYAERFRMIEEGVFSSSRMRYFSESLHSGAQSAGRGIHKLSRITASLDARLNMIAGLLLNFLLLWDIRQMRRLETWQKNFGSLIPQWFEILENTEALSSLGAFSCSNPDFIYPQINPDGPVVCAESAGHPLIPEKQRVPNPACLEHRGEFNIITGANMAGKSTYLRTIGVNMVLALAGAPVCASRFSCRPVPVYTSLRTSDNLATNQSYFYAELLRLKELIDRLRNGEKFIILLDEILKGTNSADKQSGSRALVAQLTQMGASGFIATHDLELGRLADSFDGKIRNFSFEAEIEGDELRFDYTLKPGIARNLNATFLMKRMGITI